MAKILVVDDEKDLAKVLTEKLKLEKFEVIYANNGEDGLAIALKDHPDLILLDVKMPRMDGVEVMKKLREDGWGKTIPIIFLTSLFLTDEKLEDIESDNPSYYIVKSDTSLDDIIAEVKRVLQVS
jgi:DNA-binding response OmpR family regulator